MKVIQHDRLQSDSLTFTICRLKAIFPRFPQHKAILISSYFCRFLVLPIHFQIPIWDQNLRPTAKRDETIRKIVSFCHNCGGGKLLLFKLSLSSSLNFLKFWVISCQLITFFIQRFKIKIGKSSRQLCIQNKVSHLRLQKSLLYVFFYYSKHFITNYPNFSTQFKTKKMPKSFRNNFSKHFHSSKRSKPCRSLFFHIFLIKNKQMCWKILQTFPSMRINQCLFCLFKNLALFTNRCFFCEFDAESFYSTFDTYRRKSWNEFFNNISFFFLAFVSNFQRCR